MIPKFRVAFKNNILGEVGSIDFVDETVTIPVYDKLDGDYLGDNVCGLNQVTLMQSTGLKDENGVEIYEGDIVCDQYANSYTPIFRNGIYMAYNVDYLNLTEQEPSTQFNVVWKNGCKVIGNIYENPELVEVNK